MSFNRLRSFSDLLSPVLLELRIFFLTFVLRDRVLVPLDSGTISLFPFGDVEFPLDMYDFDSLRRCGINRKLTIIASNGCEVPRTG